MTVFEATQVLVLFSVGGFFGQLLGGWLGQKLYNIDSRLQVLLMSSTTMFSVLPMHVLLNHYHIKSSPPYMAIWIVLAGLTLTVCAPNIR